MSQITMLLYAQVLSLLDIEVMLPLDEIPWLHTGHIYGGTQSDPKWLRMSDLFNGLLFGALTLGGCKSVAYERASAFSFPAIPMWEGIHCNFSNDKNTSYQSSASHMPPMCHVNDDHVAVGTFSRINARGFHCNHITIAFLFIQGTFMKCFAFAVCVVLEPQLHEFIP